MDKWRNDISSAQLRGKVDMTGDDTLLARLLDNNGHRAISYINA